MRLHHSNWIIFIIFLINNVFLFCNIAAQEISNPIPDNGDEVINNLTSSDTGQSKRETLESFLFSKIELPVWEKTDKKRQDYVDSNGLDKTHYHFPNEETSRTNNLDSLKESLNQQPNLSQGISEPDQEVVLTLIDTASTELHNIAEPHLSSNQEQALTNNLSQSIISPDFESNIKSSLPESSEKLKISEVPTINLTVDINITGFDESLPTEQSAELQNDEALLMVRAEQKPKDFLQTHENSQVDNVDKEYSMPGEFEERSTQTTVVPGSSDETAGVILDSFVGSGNSENHEDIPSFSEWAQKRLEEAEKKKTHPNVSIQNLGIPSRSAGSMKVRSKNYASPDCGAKITSVNPEARSARSVLVSTRDEYMLNPCTSKVWFIVELCEAIQAKKIELANFELFSSSPKDFSVFVSDRFPTRDWSPVGQFTAKDERDIQSFSLQPHLFGKFIKVELHSHYGSEHFCPISLFRAYGTSEFEVLETETEVQESLKDNNDDDEDVDDDDDEEDDDDSEDDDNINNSDDSESDSFLSENNHDGNESKNLFGSARDAVISIVKKAAGVLVKTEDLSVNNITKIKTNIVNNINNVFLNCMTPRYTILCNNCTDNYFTKVYELVSCQLQYLNSILKITFINRTIAESELCGFNGVNLNLNINNSIVKKKTKNFNMVKNRSVSFLMSIFKPEYVVALCNIFMMKEQKLSLNSSFVLSSNLSMNDITQEIISLSSKSNAKAHKMSMTCSSDSVNCKSSVSYFKESQCHSQETFIKNHILKTELKNSKILNPSESTDISDKGTLHITPTKTLIKENIEKKSAASILEPSKSPVEETVQAEVIIPTPLTNSEVGTLKVSEELTLTDTPTELSTPTLISQSIKNEESTSKLHTLNNDRETTKLDSKVVTRVLEEKDEKSKEKDQDDIKLTPQDQLSLDTLLLDLKALENDASIQGSIASTVNQPATSSTHQQKESVFLRLSNRIKTLERNMSLSGQYLEELSRRYKKQVEEMQRSLERATATIGEELKKSEERESKRLEEITVLREEISSLTESVETLLYDKNSWKNKLTTFGQHIVLIFVEITILIIIISFCRKPNDLENITAKKNISDIGITRRKSADLITTGFINKRYRRPSEIVSRIKGTYKELMIDERLDSRKERKKKRKRDSLIRLSSNIEVNKGIIPKTNFLKQSSSIDCSTFENLDINQIKKTDLTSDVTSSPLKNQSLTLSYDNAVNNISKNRIAIDEIDTASLDIIVNKSISNQDSPGIYDDFHNEISQSSPRGLKILKNAKLHSPSFMKTAFRSRSKRGKSEHNNPQPTQLISDNWESYSRTSGSSRSGQDSPSSLNAFSDLTSVNINGNSTRNNGHNIASDYSANGHITSTSEIKIKKEGSLRKIVKKLF
ncbi:SUN domain-containing ossification factor [Microplitis demolitor]|uniref:SUN domain-containing ossification factor n=1 Tax=Microplitis demolitor TaxID=69319 RepID=UPI0004CDBFA8|nr:SUN domain-containing ossification factor [Microplitis demolitor]